MNNCKICHSTNLSIVYEGDIRHGKFGNFLKNQQIFECSNCGVQFYKQSKIDYVSSEYRDLVQKDSSEEMYYKLHDDEQLHNLNILGLHSLRDKDIADVGCGAGSFLDSVSGIAQTKIAIEPFKAYQAILKQKNYTVYSYTEDLIQVGQQVDIATSFAVLEHIEDPVRFLSQIKQIVKPGGYILISTPNSQDALLELIGDPYKSFYYRSVHYWYFNQKSLQYIADILGFKNVEFFYKHKFDTSNLIYWLKDHKPTGLKKTNILSELDPVLISNFEKIQRSNFLYAKFHI